MRRKRSRLLRSSHGFLLLGGECLRRPFFLHGQVSCVCCGGPGGPPGDPELCKERLLRASARLLGPPTRFEASKLKVVFMGEELEKQSLSTIPRAYTLTHCDFTANLTLAVSSNTHNNKLMGWQTTLHRDDVVAEWKKIKEEMSLHVHCYVSGPNILQDLAAGFRYHIFSKELPLVLKAVVHGDSVLFSKHPELMEAKVWVYFHSKSKKYNRVECWGPLKDASQRTFDDRFDTSQASVFDSIGKWGSPKAILHALVTILL